MLYSFYYPSGALVGDGYSSSVRALCRIPDEAIADAATLDQGAALTATPEVQTPKTAPVSTAAAIGSPLDGRYAELSRVNDEIQQQVTSGKLKQQAAARLFRQKFIALFPEQAGNAQLNEYFAYAEVIGEKVDRKKLTVAEGNYELARKMSELQERHARLQADIAGSQATGAKQAADEAAAKHMADETSAKRAADAAAARTNEQRLAVEKQMLENQQAIQRQQRLEYLEGQQRLRDKQRQESLQALLKLLNPPRPNMTNCTGQWMGQTWVSNCVNR